MKKGNKAENLMKLLIGLEFEVLFPFFLFLFSRDFSPFLVLVTSKIFKNSKSTVTNR